MKKRNLRHEQIKEIVRTGTVRTQKALADGLRAQGLSCTQATVSRDIAELQLKKNSQGYYVLAEDMHLKRMVNDLVEEIRCTGNLVLIKASVGTAPGVAAALDATDLPHIVGSVAGDDTILVICESEESAQDFMQELQQMCKLQSSS